MGRDEKIERKKHTNERGIEIKQQSVTDSIIEPDQRFIKLEIKVRPTIDVIKDEKENRLCDRSDVRSRRKSFCEILHKRKNIPMLLLLQILKQSKWKCHPYFQKQSVE